MTLDWVIGGGGLLGAALVRSLQARGGARFLPADRFSWTEPERLVGQIRAAVAEFEQQARHADAWNIYWAAGVGAMGSTAAELANETLAWGELLNAVSDSGLPSLRPGHIGLASSAGAIYAGLRADVIDENCDIAPTTPYAEAKLAQERLLADFCSRGLPVAALTARISTLYGTGQARGKRQGLISHMARSIVRNRPIQIFVPFDTVRDYITAEDAAELIIDSLRTLPPGVGRMRIVAAERPTSIAEIVATFRRVARRPVLIATSASQLSSLYLRRVQFRSIWETARPASSTSLAVGVAQVLAAERLAHAGGLQR
ncbi:MAG TPA: NAD-dependent epimerase/dehydratase family protein [Roseateles sp.]|uniref:NAD-dependent epimerase/dehydratase family protein n=1 Tax=Roseateles sp. TaxID=1971397 RepID=UPI002EDAA970